ncbi:D123-domain-containing protein [Lindgomyces ingoldianus]|uniref:D123-domain-containing protein n=1 Tax=Lindgomyces ingoldianus TaxID=673940 RepID=A0ACB6QYB2_9PLEO|nr:D123-domain-containing protein [Lindgomyces ingoldianus]KAF2471267.1 D123-domain-containing protein [Lindgomyces ingoldianus]
MSATNSGSPAEGRRHLKLPFPPVTKTHILNCSYHSWHPKYRTITPKARLVPLPEAFLSYLREDGIVLPPESQDAAEWSDSDSGIFSGADNEGEDDDDDNYDPSANWRDTHEAIERVIEELGGKVTPKLNWSAPKDATWIAATNSIECRTPNDIYLLLKSSDFVTHDLQHAFDDTTNEDSQRSDGDGPPPPSPSVPYYLVLRKWITLNPSVEFRCFVRNRKLIALCQRDLNHFDFLFKMQDRLQQAIQEFFDARIRDTFPDANFTFDVYVPPPHNRVWLMDFNPWAPRTDPLLFGWLELLTLPEPLASRVEESARESSAEGGSSGSGNEREAEENIIDLLRPEFRLVRRDDPEAYGFTTPQYSAHKLPKDVVDASRGGEGSLREFALQWKEAQALAEQQKAQESGEE